MRLHDLAVGIGAFAGLFIAQATLAQGCIAVRGSGVPIAFSSFEGAGDGERWEMTSAYRWLHSDRHFVGSEEQPQRQQQHTEVINDSHFVDLSIQYRLNQRVTLGATLPFVYSDRSSLYEHDRATRHHSQAAGLADMRLMAYYLVREPAVEKDFNMLIGAGVKLPTGDYRARDTFYTVNGPVRSFVDQSIQPGDGGFGLNLELAAMARHTDRLSSYVQLAYLVNPRNTNGTSTQTGTRRGNPYEQVMSVTDQYSARVGMSFDVAPHWGLAASLGARIDGVPVHDLVGESDGFRRPGYSVTVEPGITITRDAGLFSLTVPYAVERNRQRSVADRRWTADTGIFRHGDAAFADQFVTASYTRRF